MRSVPCNRKVTGDGRSCLRWPMSSWRAGYLTGREWAISASICCDGLRHGWRRVGGIAVGLCTGRGSQRLFNGRHISVSAIPLETRSCFYFFLVVVWLIRHSNILTITWSKTASRRTVAMLTEIEGNEKRMEQANAPGGAHRRGWVPWQPQVGMNRNPLGYLAHSLNLDLTGGTSRFETQNGSSTARSDCSSANEFRRSFRSGR